MQLKENQKIIEQVILLPKRTKEENTTECRLFIDNFDLIWRHADFIINKPEFYHAYFQSAHVSVAYLGGHHIGIGQLLHLWKQKILVDTCEACHGPLYIYCAGGSPLSGSNGCVGICGHCRTISRKSLNGVRPIIEALKYIKLNENQRRIVRTWGQRFSWKYGLVGEAIPDEVIEEGIQPVTIEELITTLKTIEKEKNE